MSDTIRTTIDAAGRVVIPKHIRKQAGLTAGAPVDVRLKDGLIEIEAVNLPIRLERRGRLLVAVAEGEGPPLTTEMVNDILDSLRDERGQVRD
jgi:AbrB family looped-hinge helix DNA binding protein